MAGAPADGDCLERRLGNGQLQRIAAAHTPAYGADAVGIYILSVLQISKPGDEVLHALILQ